MAGENLNNRGDGDASWHWPAIHSEAYKFAILPLIIGVALIVMDWAVIGWPFLILTYCILAFFRDPERVVPQENSVIVSPADGLVSLITQVEPPAELVDSDEAGAPGLPAGPVTRISIFMSVFDVHINRTPIAGAIRRLIYIRGKFMNADLDKASEQNERQHILVERNDGLVIGFTQIAGLVARRIVPSVKVGDTLGVGQRVGLIRFGSRVDVYLPKGTGSNVILGQRVIAGETVLAQIGDDSVRDGIAQ